MNLSLTACAILASTLTFLLSSNVTANLPFWSIDLRSW